MPIYTYAEEEPLWAGQLGLTGLWLGLGEGKRLG